MSQTIKELSIKHQPPKPYLQPYFRPEEIPFRNIEELEFTTTDLDFFISLLGPQDQIFYRLRLLIFDTPTAEATSTFFSILASRPDVHSVEDLYLAFMLPPLHATREYMELRTLSYQSFYPLTCFGSLLELVIDWSHEISLDDNELSGLARNWPYLKVFALNRFHGFDSLPTKSLTLKGLLMLAASCRYLADICVPLDARAIPTLTDPKFDIRSISVRNLDSPDSPINRPHAVAAFLLKHFPCVTSVWGEFRQLPRDAYLPEAVPISLAYRYYKQKWTSVDLLLSHLRQHPDSE